MIELTVVVPTYNERERLPELVDHILAVFRAANIRGEVVIVDDNSPDGTGAVAVELARRDGVKAVLRPRKLGLGSAVMDGFGVAEGGVLAVMDADFSHPPSALPRLLDTLRAENADFIVASRYVKGGATPGWRRSRRLMSRLACLLARPLTPVRDATSGFFLMRRSVISGVAVKEKGFKICLELLVRGRVSRVREVPYLFTDRMAGASKFTTGEAVTYVLQVCRLLAHRLMRSGR